MGKRRNKTQTFGTYETDSGQGITSYSSPTVLGADEAIGTLYQHATVDLSKLLEYYHFGEVLPGRSNMSRSLFSVSLPDPQEPKAEFFYNYFLPNERRSIENSGLDSYLFNPLTFSSSDIEYIARQEQLPRYVKLKFSTPKYSDTLPASLISSLPASMTDLMSPEDLEALTSLSASDVINVNLARHFMGNLSDVFGSDMSSRELVDSIVSTLIVEGASSNPNFSGVEIVDTLADTKIYTILSSSMTFQEIILSKKSPRERAEIFYDKITDGGSTLPNPLGMEKREMVNILSEIQPAGIAFAPNDVADEQAELATDPITKQSFSTKFNNLFFGDIISHAARNANTVFEDEIRGLEVLAENIQNDIISSVDPTFVYEHDFSLKITPLNITNFTYSQEDLKVVIERSEAQLQSLIDYASSLGTTLPVMIEGASRSDLLAMIVNATLMGMIDPLDLLLQRENVPSAQIVGYLVQKTEVLANGTTQKFPNIFIDNPAHFSEFIDHRVRYGAVYNYKLRSIAKVRAVIKTINQADGGVSFAIGEFLIASDGEVVSVKCDEHIPPPPPIRVRARVDHERRKPVITWEFPFVKQRDVKRFQIFKRNNLDEPFTLLAEYDFDDSFDRVVPLEVAQEDSLKTFRAPVRNYRDDDFNLGYDTAIYAIACVDAHGMSSNYSAQIMINYDKYTNRLHTNVVCNEGCPKPYPNLHLTQDFFEDIIRTSGKLRCTLFFDPEYADVYKMVDTPTDTVKTSLELFKTSDVDFNYTLQFINLDMQQDKIIKIKIVDRADDNITVPVSEISKSNLSFEFGV